MVTGLVEFSSFNFEIKNKIIFYKLFIFLQNQYDYFKCFFNLFCEEHSHKSVEGGQFV